MSDQAWIIVIGILASGACALVGCFLVLQRLAMMGDAISHAVLPGIVVAFLLTESRSVLPMLLGAGLLGVVTALLTDMLSRYGKLQSDASMGVTFTWLFAIGVILVSRYTAHVDLDVDCVLYGEILTAPFDVWVVGGQSLGPRAVWLLGLALIANAAFILLGYKQLKVCSFDPGLAASMGISVLLWHYLLMGFVSVTTVAAFESVGAILVVAMLVVPPNTAYLLTDRLSHMLGLAMLFGCLSSVSGYYLAAALNGSIAAAIAVMSGMFFVLAAILSPRHGVLIRVWRRRNLGTAPEVPPL